MDLAVKKWIVAEGDKDLAASFAQKYSLNPFAALLAVSRGLRTDSQIESFFTFDSEILCDPFGYKDMDKAVERITRAIDNYECIAVFGDYDADGVTATALLSSYLSMREARCFYLLPDRAEGYGLSKVVIDRLKKQGAELIITVDNGINSVEEVEYAKSLGLDMVITDHHQAGDVLPDAVAVVNPHRPDCTGGYKDLAGVGVAFKLVCALEGTDATEDLLDEFADLVAIGTIADIVPLTGENRLIVHHGIENIVENPRPGILAMREVSGSLNRAFNSTAVAFTLSPRLNAVGRMGSAMRALEALLTEDSDIAEFLATDMEQANTERQKTELQIQDLAEKQFAEHPERYNDRVLVFDGEGWHPGVIGIVASRMVDKYGKPCIVISRNDPVSKGSGRSIEGFSLYDALKATSHLLEQFGGHTLAAGLSLKPENINAFRKAINAYAALSEMPFPVQHIDMRLNPKYIHTEILDALALLEPFGASNPKPVFGLYAMTLEGVSPLSGGKHIRLTLSKKGTRIQAVRFGAAPKDFPFPVGSTLDLAVTLDSNVYNGETRVSVLVKGARFSALSGDGYYEGIRLYERIQRGEPISQKQGQYIPDRSFMGDIYKALRSMGSCRSVEALCVALGKTDLDVCSVFLTMDALCELGLCIRESDGSLRLSQTQNKVNLADSVVLRNARACIQ